MTELEARRQLMADPHRISPELRAALAADPRLAALREELLHADAEMQRALTSAPVPEGLADRIVLRARFGTRSRWGLALAASLVALAIALPSYLHLNENGNEIELARRQAIVEHIAESADELNDDGRIEPAVLRASVAKLGVAVRDPGYRIRHLANCVIAGVESRHFIVESPRGPVSYVILPGAKDGEDAGRMLQQGPMQGLLMRRAGVTIGVFGQDGMDRGELERMLQAVLA